MEKRNKNGEPNAGRGVVNRWSRWKRGNKIIA